MSNPLSNLPPYAKGAIILGLSLGTVLAAAPGIEEIINMITVNEENPTEKQQKIVEEENPPEKQQKTVEIDVFDNDTREPLSDVDVLLQTSVGPPIKEKTDSSGYVKLTVLEQDTLKIRLSKDNYKSSITSIDISSSQRSRHPVYLEKKDSATAPNTQNPSSIDAPAPDNPAPTSTNNVPLINGFWDIKADVNKDTWKGSDSLRRGSYTFLAFFEQEDDDFTGYIADGSSSACQGKDATSISGSVQGKSVSWEVRYPGKCCHDAAMGFVGEFVDSTGTIVGKLEPTKPSLSEDVCTLLWADVHMQPR